MVCSDADIISNINKVGKSIPARAKVDSYREASHKEEKCQQSGPAAKRRKKESWEG